MPVLLVRHARAKSRQNWTGDDVDRPLTKPGRRQAEKLVELLSPYSPARVLSSPYLRCVRTVQPLADSLDLKGERVDALGEGRIDDTLKLLGELVDEAAVVCTHGDVVPAVLEALAGRESTGLPESREWAKGS